MAGGDKGGNGVTAYRGRDRGACLIGYELFHLVTVPEVMSPGWGDRMMARQRLTGQGLAL